MSVQYIQLDMSFNHIAMVRGNSGEQVFKVYWSDGIIKYISTSVLRVMFHDIKKAFAEILVICMLNKDTIDKFEIKFIH